ncbi:WbqC family protein [Salidesulfovibrio onnuriiensis]|uniref:WbqC family protein n=1 Tax=Salidesulfovibrio onnuriiensis TaxID=2583823 RepID=UPI0011CA36FD|nr:WbqC family protein [Salidesulfovibrio onnuriiensis]
MIVTIHQPDFAPWLGFFHRWAKSDLYIILDDVQFLRRGWHHRDMIKTANGPSWLTVPVIKRGKYEQRINETLIDNSSNWRKKHLGTIATAYNKAPGFKTLFPQLETIYGQNHDLLMDFNMDLLKLFAQIMGIETPMKLASETPTPQTSTMRLVELTKHHGGSVYLTGTGSRDYLDQTLFEKAGITVVWQAYSPVSYPQLHDGFASKLSIIDYLMNTQTPKREL